MNKLDIYPAGDFSGTKVANRFCAGGEINEKFIKSWGKSVLIASARRVNS